MLSAKTVEAGPMDILSFRRRRSSVATGVAAFSGSGGLRRALSFKAADKPSFQKLKPEKPAVNYLKISISGIIYEATATTLGRYPETLLGDPLRREQFYNPETDEYFFERHAPSFDAILYYYQSNGFLYRPPDVAKEIFDKECQFFDIDISLTEDSDSNAKITTETTVGRIREQLYALFNRAETSVAARIIGIMSFLMIVISTTVFCMETLPELQVYRRCTNGDFMTNFSLLSDGRDSNANNVSEFGTIPVCDTTTIQDPFFAIETVCIFWFTVEFIIQFIVSPSKWVFLKQIMNWIDLLAIAPYYMTLSLRDYIPNVSSFAMLRVLRLARVSRVFKFSRHSKGLQILGKTIKASQNELMLVVCFLLIAVVVSGTAMYFAEFQEEGSKLNNIPTACYFSVITLTTVGYGDIIPVTVSGKIIAAISSCMAVLALSLPITIIVSSFKTFYEQEMQQRLH